MPKDKLLELRDRILQDREYCFHRRKIVFSVCCAFPVIFAASVFCWSEKKEEDSWTFILLSIIASLFLLIFAYYKSVKLSRCILERTQSIERFLIEYFKDNDEMNLVQLSQFIFNIQSTLASIEAFVITIIYINILFICVFLIVFHNFVYFLDSELSCFCCLVGSSGVVAFLSAIN